MRFTRRLLLVALLAGAVKAWGAPNGREPYIGYVYPAGGRQGATFQVTAGGQFLNGSNNVYVTGDGVRATVTGYVGPLGPLTREQMEELKRRLEEIRDKRLGARGAKPGAAATPANPAAADAAKAGAPQTPKPVTLPDLPQLRNLDQQSVQQLKKVAEEFLVSPKKRQAKVPIAETVTLQVTIDPGAAVGDREIRLRTPAGLTNPLRFEVGQLPEVSEQDPSDAGAAATAPLDLPVVLNGQIEPGQVDRFRLKARRGQRLVVEVQARRLIPYLADAVPGWFQATVRLRGAGGKEVAFADDYRFDPDPVLLYEVPQDGEYTLEINDAIYRGRDDFVYRATAGELPFITRMFPLGGRAGPATSVSVAGWNLPWDRVQLDTQAAGDPIREAAWHANSGFTNPLRYAVDTLPEVEETEPNDATRDAQRVSLPVIVNGRIARPGDLDVFRFEGRAGDEIVAEVFARRLGSPLDSLLRLLDASGKVVAWNDDHEDKESGLLTHHADSYVSAKLPAAGTYFVQVSDAQHHGGEEYAYRLRLAPRQPDFALRVTPSSVNVPAGRIVPIDAYVLRKDGFDGDVELLLKGAPAGFVLTGNRIPAGRDHVRVTLAGPPQPLDRPLILQFEGRARIGAATVLRSAVPAEDLMQAFAYRHLVPSQALVVAVTPGRRFAPTVALVGSGPLRIPAGGTARIQVATSGRPLLGGNIRLQLSDPPEGVTLQETTAVPGGQALVVKADAKQLGYADNLIVEAIAEFQVGQQGGKAGNKQQLSLGVLPAIPFEVVKP